MFDSLEPQIFETQLKSQIKSQIVEQRESHGLRFHGTSVEYFRIWIVNLTLTILTLGLYSPWAKVRSLKYIYGNTELAGARFDYHANPRKMLLGRVLVGILFLGYLFGGEFSRPVGLGLAAIFWLSMPWLLVKALAFNLTNTSYRNIRFGFSGTVKDSYRAYLKAFVVVLITFGFATPYAIFLITKFKFDGIQFGNEKLKLHATARKFFGIYYLASLMFVLGASAYGGLALSNSQRMIITGLIAFWIAGLTIMLWIRVQLINLYAKTSFFGDISFSSRVTFRRYIWIFLTNAIVCVLSLGLMAPWALLRMLKYRYEMTSVHAPADKWSQISASERLMAGTASADAAADFWDVDLGL